ncbi:MAG: IS21 family transposase [Deinococcales bacterium]
MRRVREVLRLRGECRLSTRQIARSSGIGRSTVSEYLSRAKVAGLGWPLPEGVDDAELERRLFPPQPTAPTDRRPAPDWANVHQELKRKGVTLQLLWEEYKVGCPEDGFQYSWFCKTYRDWAKRLDLSMRQEHRAGEKSFIDYAGQTVPVVDPHTGEIREAQIFIAVLGASSYTYAEATWTQSLPDWIGSHIRAFEFFDGVSEILVPDNLKSGVTRPDLYEPDLNPTYRDLAMHYGTAIIPARVRRPRDKAKAEAGVLLVERWILACLRHRTFFSLIELNVAIAQLLVKLNNKPFQKLPGSRRSLFEQLDRPALRPLPTTRFEFAEWKRATVYIDYHVEVDRHYYSVPYQLYKRKVDVRFTRTTIEIFYKGNRVASHRRSFQPGGHTTITEHMPPSHRHYAEWTPERLIRWAGKIGPATRAVVEKILSSRLHPQQGFRSCLGILNLTKKYGDARLEAACRRADHIGARSCKSIASILKNGLDSQPLPGADGSGSTLPAHDNLRGAEYYR